MKKIISILLAVILLTGIMPLVMADEIENVEAPAEVVETPAEVPAESAEAPAEPAEVPAEPAETPAEAPVEAPAEPAAEPAEVPAEPAEAPADAPVEAPAEPAAAPAEVPAEPAEAPAETPVEVPAEPAEVPAEPAEEPAAPVSFTGTLSVNIPMPVATGAEASLRAVVSNANMGYSIWWEIQDAEKKWQRIEGATGEVYKFTVNKTSGSYPIRCALRAEDGTVLYSSAPVRVKEQEAAPAAEAEAPAEVPAEEPETPAEEPEVPAEEPEAPAEEPEVPAEEPEAPAEESEVPAEEPEVPAEEPEAPAEESEVPAEEPEVPAEEPEVPAEGPEVPAEEPEVPAEEPEAPAEEPEAPAEEPEAPAEEPEAPAEETEVIEPEGTEPENAEYKPIESETTEPEAEESANGGYADNSVVSNIENEITEDIDLDEETEDYQTIVLKDLGETTICLREDADGLSSIITDLNDNAEIAIISVDGDWAMVIAEDRIGYIFIDDIRSYLELQTEETEETDKAEMKVTIFSSRRTIMEEGETVYLTSKLEGFEECEEILYIWKVDKGNGFEVIEGANEETYTFAASEESLTWDWHLTVLYR